MRSKRILRERIQFCRWRTRFSWWPLTRTVVYFDDGYSRHDYVSIFGLCFRVKSKFVEFWEVVE